MLIRSLKSKHPEGNNSRAPLSILQENQPLGEEEAESIEEDNFGEDNPARTHQLGIRVVDMRPSVDNLEEEERRQEAAAGYNNSFFDPKRQTQIFFSLIMRVCI